MNKGTVARIEGKQRSFCAILGEDGTEFFAHRKSFFNPKEMVPGMKVMFRVRHVRTGPRPEAEEIRAA
jgi:cold shock CspA family protein